MQYWMDFSNIGNIAMRVDIVTKRKYTQYRIFLLSGILPIYWILSLNGILPIKYKFKINYFYFIIYYQ